MPERVAIVGVGRTQFRATSPGLSYKELMFEAATKAYADAPKAARKGSIQARESRATLGAAHICQRISNGLTDCCHPLIRFASVDRPDPMWRSFATFE